MPPVGSAESVQVKNIAIEGTEAWISSPNAPRLTGLSFSVADDQDVAKADVMKRIA